MTIIIRIHASVMIPCWIHTNIQIYIEYGVPPNAINFGLMFYVRRRILSGCPFLSIGGPMVKAATATATACIGMCVYSVPRT